MCLKAQLKVQNSEESQVMGRGGCAYLHACLCVEDEIQSSEFDKHNITHKDSLADQLCQGTYLQLACLKNTGQHMLAQQPS